MRLTNWLKPGLQIKRWLFVGAMGAVFLALGLTPLFERFIQPLEFWGYLGAGILGVFLLTLAIRGGMVSVLKGCYYQNSMLGKLDRTKINRLLYDQRILSRGPKIVVIGGGTGLSVLLRGLKQVTSNITAIVTVADDGGGSGKLREDLGMLPPGDIRNCILALAEMEPTMEQLLQYRFQEGVLKGQSFGNLLIASMNGISSNFEEAIKKIGEVLAVRGKVLPVTLEDITLFAKLKNGRIIKGESQIPLGSLGDQSPIDRVFIKPSAPAALQEALEAIEGADGVVLGPGSLYTSIIPNLLVDGIRKSLLKTEALKIYIPNMMTQPGETDGYTVVDHVNALFKHCPGLKLDCVIVNQGKLPQEVQQKYELEGSQLVTATPKDLSALRQMGIEVIEENLVDIKKDYVRHDALQLSKLMVHWVEENKLGKEKKGLWKSIVAKGKKQQR